MYKNENNGRKQVLRALFAHNRSKSIFHLNILYLSTVISYNILSSAINKLSRISAHLNGFLEII